MPRTETSSAGDSAAVLAVSDRAKAAVARMDNPAEFILSMITGASDSQKTFGCELLLMYPRYYSTAIQKTVYKNLGDENYCRNAM